MVLFPLMGPVLMGAAPISTYNGVTVTVANDEGTRYGGSAYYINFKSATQGLNALHIARQSNDTVGVDYATMGTAGTFYVTNSGGKAYFDEIILLVSVNEASLPPDFSLSLQASGYLVTVNSSGVVTQSKYVNPSLSERFGSQDFIYGAQDWKPSGTQEYSLWVGESSSDPGNASLLMFVDLYVGLDGQTSGLTDDGQVRVNYSFNNLAGLAVFNAYGYRDTTPGTPGIGDIEWTNRTMGSGSSGWKVAPGEDDTPILSRWGLLILAAFLLSALVWSIRRRPRHFQIS